VFFADALVSVASLSGELGLALRWAFLFFKNFVSSCISLVTRYHFSEVLPVAHRGIQAGEVGTPTNTAHLLERELVRGGTATRRVMSSLSWNDLATEALKAPLVRLLEHVSIQVLL